MRQDELVFERTDLMAVPWTEKPAGVLITVKPLTEAVDRIDHQQITAPVSYTHLTLPTTD